MMLLKNGRMCEKGTFKKMKYFNGLFLIISIFIFLYKYYKTQNIVFYNSLIVYTVYGLFCIDKSSAVSEMWPQ